MKKVFIPIFLALYAIFFSVQVSAAELTANSRVAVLPFKNKAAVSEVLSMGEASLLSDFMIEKLIEATLFDIVEREHLEDVMKEHSHNMNGALDPSTTAQFGKQLGVSFLIAGSLAGLSATESGGTVSDGVKGEGGVTKKTVVANVTVRFIDVETGKVVMAASGTGRSSRANAELSINKKYYEDYETTIEGENGTESVSDGTEVRTVKRKITIGSKDFNQDQVRNALYKAVADAINNKNYGIKVRLDGKMKQRKV